MGLKSSAPILPVMNELTGGAGSEAL